MRASACIWALRGYVDTDYVKVGGRWVGTGTSWRKYFEQGSAMRFKYASAGVGRIRSSSSGSGSTMSSLILMHNCICGDLLNLVMCVSNIGQMCF